MDIKATMHKTSNKVNGGKKLLEKYVPKYLLDIYSDYTVKGYCIMFVVSFASIGFLVFLTITIKNYLQ